MSDRLTPPERVHISGRGTVAVQLERMARWERCKWFDLGELLDILDHLAPPSGMTVADLYYHVAAYLERNQADNHTRRYRAWLAGLEAGRVPPPVDPYRVHGYAWGLGFVTRPGTGSVYSWDASAGRCDHAA